MTYDCDLNSYTLIHHDSGPSVFDFAEVMNRTETQQSGNIFVHFDELVHHITNYIQQSDLVVGCIAWFTNQQVIEALSDKHTSIIVQKEDFLRPDGNSNGWPAKLRERYETLHFGFERYSIDGLAGHLSQCGEPTIDAVRCVGIGGKQRYRPRMHHKFLVFCKVKNEKVEFPTFGESGETITRYIPQIVPYAVWTGSFNITDQATRSLENAVYIEDAHIAKHYFGEWAYALALSEPLDWTSEYVNPEYRIGT